MGFGNSFGVLANLFANPDDGLFNAHTIDLQITIFRVRQRAARNIEHPAGALKDVLMSQTPIRSVTFGDRAGRFKNRLRFFGAARVLPDVPGAVPELLGKDNNLHKSPS